MNHLLLRNSHINLLLKEEVMNDTILLTAEDIMRNRIICLHPKDKMHAVKEIFDKYNIHHIPICVNNNVVGIISKSDYARVLGMPNDSYDEFIRAKVLKVKPVEDYMVHEVVCCHRSAPVHNVIDLFLANEVHSVLVVEGKSLLGIITPSDLLKLLKERI